MGEKIFKSQESSAGTSRSKSRPEWHVTCLGCLHSLNDRNIASFSDLGTSV